MVAITGYPVIMIEQIAQPVMEVDIPRKGLMFCVNGLENNCRSFTALYQVFKQVFVLVHQCIVYFHSIHSGNE